VVDLSGKYPAFLTAVFETPIFHTHKDTVRYCFAAINNWITKNLRLSYLRFFTAAISTNVGLLAEVKIRVKRESTINHIKKVTLRLCVNDICKVVVNDVV
jgi:hypothetical protein